MGPACTGFTGQNNSNYLLPENGDGDGCRNILLLELIRLYLKNIACGLGHFLELVLANPFNLYNIALKHVQAVCLKDAAI